MEVFGGIIKLQDNVTGVLKQATASSGTFRSEVNKAKAELDKFDKQKLKQKEIRVKNSEAYKAIEGVKKKLEPVTKTVINLKAKEEHALGKIKKVKDGLSQIKENKVINFVAKGAAGVVKAATTVAIAGTAAALTTVATAGTAAIGQAVAFESQMKNVSTLLDGDVNAKISSLGAEVRNISKETGLSTENLTGGLYEVISAFGESADSSKQLEIAAKAAKAGNAETAESVKMLSAVTKGYGDTSSAAVQKAADLAFQTVKLGQTSFPELAASMGAVVPLASTLKVSQEELFGAMSTLTGVTGNTSEVTTQLKATMQGFMSPTKEMSAALKKMGYSSGAAALESESLGSILNKLKESVHGDEVAFASLFSSVEAQNAVLALAGSQAENFATKTDAMAKASGSADRAFERQTTSVKAMAEKIKNTGTVMLLELGEKALPVVSSALETMVDHLPQLEAAAGSVFSKISPVLDSAISGVVGIAETAVPMLESVFSEMQSAAASAFPTISSIVGQAGGKVQSVLSLMSEHTGLFQSVVATAGPAISGVLSSVWSVASPLLDLAIAGIDLLLSAFKKAFPAIQSVVSACWNVISPIITSIGKGVSAVAGTVGKVASWIKGDGGSGGRGVGNNATGTSYWRGGYTTLAEHGPELVQLPTGAKVYSNSKTNNILRQNREAKIVIQNMTIREEADIDKVAKKIVEELDKVDR